MTKLTEEQSKKTLSLELTWSFEPDNLFEADLEISSTDYTVAIGLGRVVATTGQSPIDTLKTKRADLEEFVVNLFLGAQIVNRVSYKLLGPTVTHIDKNGIRNYIIECQTGHIKICGGTADLIYTRSDGVVVDTKADRIKRRKLLAQQCAHLARIDYTMARMLRSHQAALLDRDDELIHLYEIRDAVAARLGGDHAARRKLNVPHKLWSRFGELCNELPLKQGRHRGKANGELRDVNEIELTEARSFAVMILEAYIRYRTDSLSGTV